MDKIELYVMDRIPEVGEKIYVKCHNDFFNVIEVLDNIILYDKYMLEYEEYDHFIAYTRKTRTFNPNVYLTNIV